MFEIILALINPPSWYALYIGVLLGVGVNIVCSLVDTDSFTYFLSHEPENHFNHSELEIKRLNIYTLHDWISTIIRRKECPGDDVADHHSFSVL